MPVVRRSSAVKVDDLLPPELRSKLLAQGARRLRDEAIRKGEAPPAYETFVDGVRGAVEDAVRPDGTILYRFNLMPDVVEFALAFLRRRSPVDRGIYASSWLVTVGGTLWTQKLTDLPAGAEVIIVNPVPYARKIDVGAMKMSVGPGIVEDARRAVRREFPNIDAWRLFVNLTRAAAPGANYDVPYVLKRHARPRAAKQNNKSSAFRAGRSTLSVRKDRQAGAEVTYPALQLKVKR